jgi:AcrR family transcriptional regulator
MERATYHHGDLAASLLATGLELLEAEGAEGLSLRAVARAAGVSPNAPYRHYADKDDLLAALAAEGLADVRGRLDRLDGEDRLVEAVCQGVRFARERPQIFRLIAGHICSDRPAVQAAMSEVMLALMRALHGPGEVELTPSRQAFCTGVWALTQGLSTMLLDGSARPAAGESVDDYVARVVRATLPAS